MEILAGMAVYSFKAVIFDMDGVITRTAEIHRTVWKTVFDDFFSMRESRTGQKQAPFTDQDYLLYLDGKPRSQGIESFLNSRNVIMPMGEEHSGSTAKSIVGIGTRKDNMFKRVLMERGIEVFSSSIALIKALKRHRIHVGVASSSENCELTLKVAGIEALFETRMDGVNTGEMGLRGKPAPDIFIQASRNLGVAPEEAIVVEDAISGVQAGKEGNFGLVLGVARDHNEEALLKNGADVVVTDLEEVSLESLEEWFSRRRFMND